MQTQTLENKAEIITPYNDVAELIDREIHGEMLERINFLAREYEINNPSEVAKFLLENFFLFDLLKEVPGKIREYFGEKQKTVLKISYEPEYPNAAELWVEILTELSAKDAMQILDRFDEEWWFEKVEKSHGRLNITLKFI
jgi:hypothetical protein